MNIFGDMMSNMIGAQLPAYNINYVWEVQWLFEDEQTPPHILNHIQPKEALNQMISLLNAERTLIYLSIARRNA